MSWKKSLLPICKILELFLNTLTADDKYSLLNRENLTQPIQTQLCNEQRTFPHFFCKFSKSRLNFEHFQKKMTLIAHAFWKLQTVKYMVRKMSKKFCFRRPFNKQHGKLAKTMLKDPLQHFYHIYSSLWMQWSWKKCLLPICKILGLLVNLLTAED